MQKLFLVFLMLLLPCMAFSHLLERSTDNGGSQSFGVVTVTLPVNGLRVFPNPIASGNTINVLGAAAGARVELFGMDGRFILNLPAATEAGAEFSPPKLVPGRYLPRATSLTGERKTTKTTVR